MARFALLTLAVAAVCGAVIFVGGRSEPAVSAIPAVPVPTATSGSGRNGPDALLVKTMREINANRLDGALAEVDRIIGSYPNFRLAHLIKGDILLARARPLTTLGDVNGVPLDQVEDLREEARVRIARYERRPPATHVPRYLVQLTPEQQHAFVVDTSSSTLYVFRNEDGGLRYVDDFYVSIGKNGINKIREGDNRTPLGVYHVTKWMSRAQLASEYGKQSELYGVGALPLNYPNAWDRREGREGHGIWLHGVPFDTYSRPPRSSNGCVALTNEDFETLTGRAQIGLTPVVITDGIDWVAPQSVTTVRLELTDQLERWRRDWESLDTEKYLEHYAAAFSSGRSGLREWSTHKRRVNSGKKWVKVNLDKVSIVLYPGRDDLAVITFRQDYKSSNLKSRMLKRQYWMKDGGSWRILYEGSA
jgi:murein L,D-transpeptidase YafK